MFAITVGSLGTENITITDNLLTETKIEILH